MAIWRQLHQTGGSFRNDFKIQLMNLKSKSKWPQFRFHPLPLWCFPSLPRELHLGHSIYPKWAPHCGPAFFTCVPTQSTRLAFIWWKINFWKSRSHHLFYFYFKGKIKQERKTLKRWLHNFWKKRVFEKPELRSGDQVIYWEGTFKR